jgi:hypothetical protein
MFLQTLVVVAFVTGCDNAMDDQRAATRSQAEANAKIAAAEDEVAKKSASAQAVADKAIAAATADFMRLREDYRHNTAKSLVDLDHRVDALQASARGGSAKAAADLEVSLQQIRTKRRAFDDDYLALEGASAATWDAARAKLDMEWSELKALVDKA